MASRRLHLSVAARLRGITVGYDHRHSGLSTALVFDYLDAMNAFELAQAEYIAQSSVMGHPDVDLEKSQGSLDRLYYDMLAALEYPSGGKQSKELIEDERMAAVQQFLEMRKRMLKDEKDVVKPQQEEIVIKEVG